ncbi:DHA2 family efflux MFS transporter permease subunit [Herbiconiux sp. CPCC 205763]|uniref:DHA2 family efflux MFS transporter permease subunit n=1 Tax=Herbiconiux aconitum TaxID=2970913 RepID=A0ABT2GT32_9MICO|nr:DHA2 family efflux MFS transporter permease subunit [Herbiconiux aconitum]MCS5719350.1 DHA2 family efflux MFS transporter permease subunit [Herbiconiux aconitum]
MVDVETVPLRSSRGVFVLAATVLASTIGFLDASVVNVAIPAIGKDLNAAVGDLQWTVTSYLVAVTALLLVAGALSDRYGRRRILVIGLSITLVASVFCALAPDSSLLVVGRIAQGIGGALTVPSSLALLNGTLQPRDRPRGIGLWAALSTVGYTVGPYAGGWLVDNASWRWLFILNVPLVILALLALIRVREQKDPAAAGGIDYLGAVLIAIGLGAVVFALTDGSASGWGRPSIIISAVVGIGCLVALVPVELRVANPVLNLRLFRSKQFSAINASTLLFYAAISGVGYLVLLRLQLQLDYTPTLAGAALIPSSVVFLVVAPISGNLVAKFGPRWLMAVGILVAGLGFFWLSFLGPTSSYWLGVLPGNLLQGLGFGLAVTPLTSAVLAAVRSADLGEASAINNAVSRLGGAVAIAVIPALAGPGVHTLAETIDLAYQPGMVITAVLCLAAAVIAAVFVSNAPAAAPLTAAPMPHACLPEAVEERVPA